MKEARLFTRMLFKLKTEEIRKLLTVPLKSIDDDVGRYVLSKLIAHLFQYVFKDDSRQNHR